MAARQVLILGAAGLTAWPVGAGKTPLRPVSFTPDEAGVARFAAYLQTQRGARCRLLLNLVEEEFREISLPLLGGSDRRLLVQRRLAEAFPDTPYVAAQSLARRRDSGQESLLLAASTAPQLVAPWLATLKAAPVKLDGIELLPFLLPELLRRLTTQRALPASDCCLLFTVHPGSLRQSLLVAGRLRFSRSIAWGADDDLATRLPDEGAALERYLGGRGLLGGAAPLRLLIAAAAHLPPAAPAGFSSISASECARRCGVARADEAGEHDLEAICATLAARGRQRPQFAPPALLQAASRQRFWRAAGLGAAAIWLLAAGLAGERFFSAWRLDQASERLLAEAASLAAQVADLAALSALAAAEVPAASAEAMPALLARLDARRRLLADAAVLPAASPAPFYSRLGQLLTGQPAISLHALEWRAGGARAENGAAESAASLVVQGSVGKSGSADAFARLLAALNDDPALEVSVQRRPGAAGDQFSLRLLLKGAPPARLPPDEAAPI